MPACATAAQEAVPAGACLGSWQCRIRTCAPLARVVHACRHLSFVSFGAAFAQFAWICFLKELHFLKLVRISGIRPDFMPDLGTTRPGFGIRIWVRQPPRTMFAYARPHHGGGHRQHGHGSARQQCVLEQVRAFNLACNLPVGCLCMHPVHTSCANVAQTNVSACPWTQAGAT